ncbi:MAG: hypothetical protein AAGG45_10255 [Pseudomonadota bacterium]
MIKIMIAATILPLSAAAANAASWAPTPGQDGDAPRAVYSETAQGTALLTCDAEGKMTAILSQITSNFAETLEKQAPYRRAVDVEISTPERYSEATWVSLPAIKTIVSSTHSVGARIFNTVVREEPIEVKVDGKDFVSLDLPAADDSFKAFAKTCRS